LTPAFVFQLETTPFIYTSGLTLFYLGSGMLLVGVLLSRVPRRRAILFLATLGAYSYSIYLWHMPVISWGVPLVERAWGSPLGFGISNAIYCIGSLVLGVIMARIVERPALRLRDHWFPPRGSGPIEDETTGPAGTKAPLGDRLAAARERKPIPDGRLRASSSDGGAGHPAVPA
jgi:peptidoglycan/LPS O-acetylase OafA/YrhL